MVSSCRGRQADVPPRARSRQDATRPASALLISRRHRAPRSFSLRGDTKAQSAPRPHARRWYSSKASKGCTIRCGGKITALKETLTQTQRCCFKKQARWSSRNELLQTLALQNEIAGGARNLRVSPERIL